MIHEWDTAAADAILRGAGGMFTDLSGNEIIYNKAEPTVQGIIGTFSNEHLADIADFYKNKPVAQQ